MASIQTSRWVSTAPYVKLTVTETDYGFNGNGTYSAYHQLSIKLQYISDYAASTSVAKEWSIKVGQVTYSSDTYGAFNINGKTGTHTIFSIESNIAGTHRLTDAYDMEVSFGFNLTWSDVYKGTATASGTVPVTPATRYSIIYSANGGTGAPSAQYRYTGETITLRSTSPSRTGYTFEGWGTSSSDTTPNYQPGDSYSGDANLTLYAIWEINTYTVTYNANGGTNAPSKQTKTHGQNLTLTTATPTRTNYDFVGWGTTTTATAASYVPGGLYAANKSITLYAIWKSAYKIPTIVNLVADRCDSSGTLNDSGTYALVSFDWTTTKTVTEVEIEWGTSSETVAASDTSGSVSEIVGGGNLDTETTYTIKVTVKDASGSFSYSKSLPGGNYPIDFKAGGTGVAFGKSAELDDTAEFEYDVKFNGAVYGKVLGMDKVTSIPTNANLDEYLEPGCYAVYRNDTSTTITNIPVQRAGRLEVWSSTGEGIRAEEYSYVRQRYIPYQTKYPTYDRELIRGSNNQWTPGPWVRSKGAALLWSGVYYMTDTQTVILNDLISNQPTGIELVFSMYTDGEAENINFNHFQVNKEFVAAHPAKGSSFFMTNTDCNLAANKYLYISDGSIAGYSKNADVISSTCGIQLNNNRFVLRAVYGI